MSKDEAIEVAATVIEPLPHAMFRVELDEQAPGPGAHRRATRQELHPASWSGDKVLVELSPYDLTRGRIIAGKPVVE